jgi:hypothetical protein
MCSRIVLASLTAVNPITLKRSVVLSEIGGKFRTSIVPPLPAFFKPEMPDVEDFDDANGGLGYATTLARLTGWRFVDLRRNASDVV